MLFWAIECVLLQIIPLKQLEGNYCHVVILKGVYSVSGAIGKHLIYNISLQFKSHCIHSEQKCVVSNFLNSPQSEDKTKHFVHIFFNSSVIIQQGLLWEFYPVNVKIVTCEISLCYDQGRIEGYLYCIFKKQWLRCSMSQGTQINHSVHWMGYYQVYSHWNGMCMVHIILYITTW